MLNTYVELENNTLQEFLQNLTRLENSEYSLWKATNSLKQPHQQIPHIGEHLQDFKPIRYFICARTYPSGPLRTVTPRELLNIINNNLIYKKASHKSNNHVDVLLNVVLRLK